MSRLQTGLTVALAAQLALLAWIYLPSGRADAAAGTHALLPALETITPARIEIDEPAPGDDAARKSLALRRDGERWVLEQADGYPADPEKVRALLDNLRGLRVGRPVLSSGRYHEALEVAESKHQRRLRVWEDPDGKPRVDLLLGSSPNYRIRHARLAGDDRVYELRGLEYYDLRPDAGAWIEKKLVDVPVDDLVAVGLENGHGRFELARRDGAWSVAVPDAGREPDAAKTDAWVRSIASLWISEPGGPLDPAEQGLEPPAATLTLTYRAIAPDAAAAETAPAAATGTRTVIVRLGREAEGGKRYAGRDGFEFAVLLGEFDAEKIEAKKLADLLASDAS